MSAITVEAGEYRVCAEPGSELVCFGLGPSIALAAFDPAGRIGGLLCFMLPSASTCPASAREKPSRFADLGVPLLLEAMTAVGARPRGLILTAVGGARAAGSDPAFDLGRRNYVTLRKVLWKAGLGLAAEDVGGSRSRTVRLHLGTGRLVVSCQGESWEPKRSTGRSA